jgi:galactonate dehydratase
VDPADGCFALPTAPGLGVRLDHAAVARHPRTHAYLNLVQEGWELRGAPLARPGGGRAVPGR